MERRWKTSKLEVCIQRTADYSPPNYAASVRYGQWPADYAVNSKSRTDRCTRVEESLADRGDGEELTDTNLGGVHSTDSSPPNYAP